MAKRKRISLTTKLASALLALGHITYDEAKKLTEKQVIGRYNFDHNILHETGHPDRDKFWNLTPMLIPAHREKTKRDAGIIAKGRRIREPRESRHKIRSRGFDKTLRRKMDGTVVRRER